MNSDYQSKYWALEVQTSSNNTDINKLSGSLVTSNIDLNPHQIDAALFALKSPVSQGAILADEVGLGKTIEAGIILSEYFSRSKKHLLVIAPASLRTQWKNELEEKFNLPAQIIDNTTWQQPRRKKGVSPFDFEGVTIVSYNFVVQGTKDFSLYPWDLVVFDEAHKLRNFYKGDNKTANIIYKTFANTKKLLLTATPIQNSLMDIFSLVSLIDANILGNQDSFIETYMYTERKHQELRQRLQSVLHRTLRKDVLEYIRYTNREAMTVAFEPSPEEEELYNRVSLYIKLHAKFGIQSHARNLVVMMIRKLMSSSTAAVKGTLKGIRDKVSMLQELMDNGEDVTDLINIYDMTSQHDPEIKNYNRLYKGRGKILNPMEIDPERKLLDDLIALADSIKVDGKTLKLISAIEEGFAKKKQRKVIIFTESYRTLEYLFDFLTENGFRDKIITFSGNNNSPLHNRIYKDYCRRYPGKVTGSKATDMRQAIVSHFRDNAEIMIATEAAAEGLNLQFCSLLINYDLPWNPQRIEQRIGRVHRYGQKQDVVIINFINKKNLADIRLYDILQYKFKLFDGVFGASDEILGSMFDGVDFERAVAKILDECRTEEEITKAFDALQEMLNFKREQGIEQAKQLILENLNPTLQEKLHVTQTRVETFLSRDKQIFWNLTKNILKIIEPDFFINDDTKTFGQFETQVFPNVHSEINFAVNFSHRLDYTKRDTIHMYYKDKKALRRQPAAYNPQSAFGKRVLATALELKTPPAHLIIKALKLKAGLRGRVRVSLYKQTAPDINQRLICTFISHEGEKLDISPEIFFDNIIGTEPIRDYSFADLLISLHENDVKSAADKDKKATAELLREETEKLNRWQYDEVNGIRLGVAKIKNKIDAAHKKLFTEKIISRKLALRKKIAHLQEKYEMDNFASLDKEKAINLAYKRLLEKKKKALKFNYSSELVFDCTFTTFL